MNAVTCQCGKEWKIQDNLSAYEGEVVLVCECGRRHFNAQDFFSAETLAELGHVSVNKGDIVTALLRCGDIRHSNSLYMLAAEEIQRLREDLKVFEDGYSRRLGELTENQAREAKLREALEKIANNTIHWYSSIQDAKEALDMPTEDTALQEAIKQAKREALEEAAKFIEKQSLPDRYSEPCLEHFADEIRRMAEEKNDLHLNPSGSLL
jgi:hypothetical protein